MATALASNSRKRPRVRRSSSKNAKSMRFNVPAYGTWVLSDYITAGKQPACFHCSTLARTKAHTFGTFRHLDPNSTGCLDPEARNRPDHSDSIASGWPQRGNIWPSSHASHRLTRTLTQLPRRSSFLRVAPPPKTPHQRGRQLMLPGLKVSAVVAHYSSGQALRGLPLFIS